MIRNCRSADITDIKRAPLQRMADGPFMRIATIIENEDKLTALAADRITDADIRAAYPDVPANTNLEEERGATEFQAALATMRASE